MHPNLIRRPEVKQRTGLSRSTIYARIAERTFPEQIPRAGRVVGWLDSEIEQWIADQIDTRNGGTEHA